MCLFNNLYDMNLVFIWGSKCFLIILVIVLVLVLFLEFILVILINKFVVIDFNNCFGEWFLLVNMFVVSNVVISKSELINLVIIVFVCDWKFLLIYWYWNYKKRNNMLIF